MGNETKNIIHVAADTWDNNVLRSEKPVLVDFWAEWCGPCRMVGPALEQLSETMNGKVKIVKLNVDENQEIAMKYGIKSIPSLVLFKEGHEIGRTVGAASKETYQRFIEQFI
ncbi:MAG TPA: thioredoxin [Nitrososphaeraceae archaeon]|jgi:thioredoxin 1|nr:thioredoxin [Nitrososphaeraceae archaeon]